MYEYYSLTSVSNIGFGRGGDEPLNPLRGLESSRSTKHGGDRAMITTIADEIRDVEFNFSVWKLAHIREVVYDLMVDPSKAGAGRLISNKKRYFGPLQLGIVQLDEQDSADLTGAPGADDVLDSSGYRLMPGVRLGHLYDKGGIIGNRIGMAKVSLVYSCSSVAKSEVRDGDAGALHGQVDQPSTKVKAALKADLNRTVTTVEALCSQQTGFLDEFCDIIFHHAGNGCGLFLQD